jgi:hypothetical protein
VRGLIGTTLSGGKFFKVRVSVSKGNAKHISILSVSLICLMLILPALATKAAFAGDKKKTPTTIKAPIDVPLFLIIRDRTRGFIDVSGRIVIKPQFGDAEDFTEGLAAVRIGDKRGYIDTTGRVVIKPQFDMATKFSEGLAAVGMGEDILNPLWGYIDRTGRFVVNPGYKSVEPFSCGMALVTDKNEKRCFINKAGRCVIDVNSEDVVLRFSDDLAWIRYGKTNKQGFIDKNGKQAIVLHDGSAQPFSEGLAGVDFNKRSGFINKEGNIVINPLFDMVSRFTEGLAGAQIHGKWGFIDRSGDFVIDPKFDSVWQFNHGLAAVQLNGKWGYIDGTGSFVIPTKFYRASPFAGLAQVQVEKDFYYINKQGNIVTKVIDE